MTRDVPPAMPPASGLDDVADPALASARWREVWLGGPKRVELSPSAFGRGLTRIEVSLAAPAYVDLIATFEGSDAAPLRTALERIGSRRYGATVSLIRPPRHAVLEIIRRQHPAAEVPTVVTAAPSVARLARLGLRAVARHVREPNLLLRKARQVLAGGSTLVLSSASANASAEGEFDYGAWREAFEAGPLDGASRPPTRVLLPVVGWSHGEAALDSLIASVRQATRATVEVLDLRGLAQAKDALARRVAADGTDLVLLVDRPGRLHPAAPGLLAHALAEAPHAVAVYCDHDRLGPGGERDAPVFKPAWSPDLQRAAGYIGGLLAVRPAAFDSAMLAVSATSASPVARVARHLADALPQAGAIAHVPLVLFHESGPALRTDPQPPSLASLAEGMPLRPMPKVAVIIPTKDNPELLARALASVTQATGVDAEIIIVDNGAQSEAQRALLAEVRSWPKAQVIAAPGTFNFSDLINLGRRAACSDVLVLLNDDVEAHGDDSWLATLARDALRPGVGAVGALLLYPDGRVQHGGVLLGINGGAGHAFRFSGTGDGADPRIMQQREVSAVTAACLAVATEAFDAVGGFSEDLPVTLNDVDFCLKLRAAGYRNLYCPRARLIHRESTSRGLDATPEKLHRLARETARFLARWGDAGRVDPYLGPHASPSHEDLRPRCI